MRATESSVLAVRDFTRAVRTDGEVRSLFRDLSFDLIPGSILGILGPRGAGKTSILRGILRLDAVSMGTVQWHQGAAAGAAFPTSGTHVRGLLGAGPPLPGSARDACLQLAAEKPHANATDRSECDERLRRFAAALDVAEATLNQPLSHQEPSVRYRAWAAVLAALNPPFLLLDEPTSALDKTDHHTFGRFLRILASEGMGILLATGDELLIARACHRVLVLFDGALHAEGTVEDLLPAAFTTVARSQKHAPRA